MRIAGQPTQSNYQIQIQLPRPDGTHWPLTIRPLRLGFHKTLRDHGITHPQTPIKIARDSQGKVLRDSDGKAITHTDDQNPNHKNEVETYHQRVAVLMIWEALQNDPQVEFETTPLIESESWTTFADQLYEELEQSGWTAGDLIWLCQQIARISQLTDQHTQQAQQNFF